MRNYTRPKIFWYGIMSNKKDANTPHVQLANCIKSFQIGSLQNDDDTRREDNTDNNYNSSNYLRLPHGNAIDLIERITNKSTFVKLKSLDVRSRVDGERCFHYNVKCGARVGNYVYNNATSLEELKSQMIDWDKLIKKVGVRHFKVNEINLSLDVNSPDSYIWNREYLSLDLDLSKRLVAVIDHLYQWYNRGGINVTLVFTIYDDDDDDYYLSSGIKYRRERKDFDVKQEKWVQLMVEAMKTTFNQDCLQVDDEMNVFVFSTTNYKKKEKRNITKHKIIESWLSRQGRNTLTKLVIQLRAKCTLCGN